MKITEESKIVEEEHHIEDVKSPAKIPEVIQKETPAADKKKKKKNNSEKKGDADKIIPPSQKKEEPIKSAVATPEVKKDE